MNFMNLARVVKDPFSQSSLARVNMGTDSCGVQEHMQRSWVTGMSVEYTLQQSKYQHGYCIPTAESGDGGRKGSKEGSKEGRKPYTLL